MLYAKIHKNKAENLLHLMLYFSVNTIRERICLTNTFHFAILKSEKPHFYLKEMNPMPRILIRIFIQ